MTHQIIALKFRPSAFDQLIGQEHIRTTLKRAIETGRIHHAFLFTGARGVGKTSTARILAKALNCQNGPTASPCDTCKSCQEITQGSSLDVREIDGASNTGVDDVRQLREDARYLPNSGRYRIYIIDEVHMLSNNAFNALLKTLEEPPAHVIFIFATTEPHKIPDTILSRTQRYDFRLISHKKIVEHLKSICDKEKVAIDDAALHLISQEGAGSMRDAQTILEQVIANAEGTIRVESVTQSLGLPDRQLLLDCLKAITEGNGQSLLHIVKSLYDHGHDLKHFCQDLLQQLRHLEVIKTVPNQAASLLDIPDDEVAFLQEIAAPLTPFEIHRLFNLLAQDYYAISHSPIPKVALEMALLRTIATPPLEDIATLIEELRSGHPQPGSSAHGTTATVAMKTPASRPTPTTPTPAKPANWDGVLAQVQSQKPRLASFLKEVKVLQCNAQKIELGVPNNPFFVSQMSEEADRQILLQAAKLIFGQQPELKVNIIDDLKAPALEEDTKRKESDRLAEELKQSPLMRNLQKTLGAEIEEVKKI